MILDLLVDVRVEGQGAAVGVERIAVIIRVDFDPAALPG